VVALNGSTLGDRLRGALDRTPTAHIAVNVRSS
jgi:hypothetical protein